MVYKSKYLNISLKIIQQKKSINTIVLSFICKVLCIYVTILHKNDIKLILRFIRRLAQYENVAHKVVATEEMLSDWIFNKKRVHVLIGEYEGESIGFALYYYNFSTFLGRGGIHLEDLYVLPKYRNKGFGKQIIKKLCEIAVKDNCSRVEWTCLNWNKPSINFYLSLGAKPMTDWTIYRISEENLELLGGESYNI